MPPDDAEWFRNLARTDGHGGAMKVYTTGDVAGICKVAMRTVHGWIDSGKLKGYKLPGSTARRVTHAQLERFMREHGLPLENLPEAEVSAK